MASGKYRTASDSEDSEGCVVRTSRNCHHSRVTIEELLYEIELARYFKRLQECRKASQFQKRSVYCQTDPDTSGVPPSWIFLLDKSACELHAGLGNIINKAFHSSDGYCKGKREERACQRMEYFRYVDGHYESRLLPGIRMPESALPGINADFKRELESLMEKAWKLTVISGAVVEALCNGIKLEEISDTECENVNKENKAVPCCSHMRMQQTDSLQNDVHPRKFLPEFSLPKSMHVRESGLKAQSGSSNSSVTRNIDLDGVGEKFERKPLAANVRADEPTTSGLSRRVGEGQENRPPKNKVNFIRKNILATKTAVIRNRFNGGRRL